MILAWCWPIGAFIFTSRNGGIGILWLIMYMPSAWGGSCQLLTNSWLQDLLSKVVFYFLIKIYTLYNFKTNKFMIHIFQVFLASVQRRPSCAAVLVASDRVSWGQSGDSHVLSYTCRVKKASWLSSVWFKESSPHTDSSFATYVRNLQVSFENEICLDFADR